MQSKHGCRPDSVKYVCLALFGALISRVSTPEILTTNRPFTRSETYEYECLKHPYKIMELYVPVKLKTL